MYKIIWLFGLSGSGKSTIAEKLVDHLKTKKMAVEYLDGDVIRALFPNTGFTREDRMEHIKRVALRASSFEKKNTIVVISLITPFEEARAFIRIHCKNLLLTYIKAPLELCEKRDVKGLYKKARAGEIKNFTGIDSPFEEPMSPDLVLDTEKNNLETCLKILFTKIG